MTKRIFPFILFSLLALSIQAQELSTCEKEILEYGKTPLTSGCLELLKEKAIGNNKRNDDELEAKVYAVEGAIIYEEGNRPLEVFAGEQAKIEDPVAIVSDIKNQELAYLNKSGDVFLFSTRFFGNISPVRTLKNNNLFGAIDLCFTKDHLVVLNDKDKKIIFYHRSANSMGHTKKKKTEILNEVAYYGSSFKSLSCSSDGKAIYLLSQDSDVYNLNAISGRMRKIKSNTGLDSLRIQKRELP